MKDFNRIARNLILRKGTTITVVFILLVVVFQFTRCKNSDKPKAEGSGPVYSVTAWAETMPVPRDYASDAADDPAIWINNRNPDSSCIIGTDKKGGLAVYDLTGKEKFYYKTGQMNNVDLRYRFPLNSDSIDILAVSNRTDLSVDLYRINSDGSLQVIHERQLKSAMKGEIYGLCMYQSKTTGKFYVYANSKEGEIEQWELASNGDMVTGRIVRNLKLDNQTEGMAADDETGSLYVGEEDKGIWKFSAEPSGKDKGELISMSGENDNKNIEFDIEGLAIYFISDGDGYIIASSQGNDSYALFDRKPPHNYLGSFKIVDGLLIDGTEETDGLDVTSFCVGEEYPNGMLVVQDGENKDNGNAAPQNFKFIKWDSIALKFNPSLKF